MKRREFITLLSGAPAAWPPMARAQQLTKIRLIGFLGTDTESNSVPWVDGLRAGLLEFGYFEGKNIAFEFRYADGKYERLAHELLERKLIALGRQFDALIAIIDHGIETGSEIPWGSSSSI